MFKTIESEILREQVSPELRREFLQHDYERLRPFCKALYVSSIGMWLLFDLIISFQGGQGFTPLSLVFLGLFALAVAVLAITRRSQNFALLNLAFLLCYCLGLRLITEGLPLILQPVWLTLLGTGVMFCASVVPMAPVSFYALLIIVWVTLCPLTGFDSLPALHRGLLISCWVCFTGVTTFTYRHLWYFKLLNFVMARRLLEQAYLDVLTEVPNRRAFVVNTEPSFSTAEAGNPHYLAMIDVDNFKQVNDRFGHDIGDEVLKHVGLQLKRVMQGQVYARLGGEEFGVLLRGLTRMEAEQLASELCRQIREAPSEHPVTVSIGLARVEIGSTLSQALVKADRALYESKHAGKNRVTYAD
ncbi:MAG: putative diguanylate cyclase DgcT [Stenotrophomonas maltophilia]|nr:MAG: putative diguanylate cyclase DgcT [Stenotrophomonas maltophilia]